MLFEIKNLKFRYAGQNAVALELDSFTINEGDRIFLRGRSGSGKSTFLNLLAGVLSPPKNSIFYRGEDFASFSPGARDRIRASEMGIIFQQFNLLPYLSAEENVFVPFAFNKNKSSDYVQRATELFEHLGLSKNTLSKPVHKLSVGQQQRVAVVRALVHKPKIILADEPTSSLDSEARDDFISLLNKESEAIGASVIFVSHDPGLEKHFKKTLHLKSVGSAV